MDTKHIKSALALLVKHMYSAIHTPAMVLDCLTANIKDTTRALHNSYS